MRIKRIHFIWLILIVAALAGAGLGYMQDGIFQAMADRVDSGFYIVGMLGWLIFAVWQVLALHYPALRWRGLLPQWVALAVLILFWGFAVVGEAAYFLINGMDSFTLVEVVLGAMLISGAHTFALIVLPMLISRVALMLSRKRDAKSALAAEHLTQRD